MASYRAAVFDVDQIAGGRASLTPRMADRIAPANRPLMQIKRQPASPSY
jgi:hypothetical protein